MDRGAKTSKSQPIKLKKYLYLVNIGLYSLAIYLSTFIAEAFVSWWLEDANYQLDYASYIWFPISLLLLNPVIWRKVYPTLGLEIVGIGLLCGNLFLLTFMGSSYRMANALGWGVVTVGSIALTVYTWYRAKPWKPKSE